MRSRRAQLPSTLIFSTVDSPYRGPSRSPKLRRGTPRRIEKTPDSKRGSILIRPSLAPCKRRTGSEVRQRGAASPARRAESSGRSPYPRPPPLTSRSKTPSKLPSLIAPPQIRILTDSRKLSMENVIQTPADDSEVNAAKAVCEPEIKKSLEEYLLGETIREGGKVEGKQVEVVGGKGAAPTSLTLSHRRLFSSKAQPSLRTPPVLPSFIHLPG